MVSDFKTNMLEEENKEKVCVALSGPINTALCWVCSLPDEILHK